jgi:hypothetical protein
MLLLSPFFDFHITYAEADEEGEKGLDFERELLNE